MIIFDNHLHLRRDGRFLDAVKDFKKSGGTHFILCQYPMPEMVIKQQSYMPAYKETLRMAKEIKSKLNVGVFVTVGPYPVDYLLFAKRLGRDAAIDIMKKGMDEAAELCLENECVGIGEIGRPHFEVEKQVIKDSNQILFYGMQKAKDAGVPVILHTESTTSESCKELVEMGKEAGISNDKIVKHYSPPLILENENYGLMPSVLASKKNILAAIGKGTRFLMETDYIDDPRRPGAVLGPKTVPKRTKELIEKGIMTLEDAYIIHKENPKRTYEIDLEG
ncbi:MAG: TatD family hydrolase [Candidatus Thermoplasmatota archaeon]|nr:TatD family hydrolase [Candidatus Thermoplasmatota archaeon]